MKKGDQVMVLQARGIRGSFIGTIGTVAEPDNLGEVGVRFSSEQPMLWFKRSELTYANQAKGS